MPITVAIIDSAAQVRKRLCGYLRCAAGFRLVGSWADAKTALRTMPDQKPDVVLMDIKLSGMNGVEALRRLKVLLPNTQFVILTDYEDRAHIYSSLAAGASGYLLKQPFPEELLTALDNAHRGGVPMSRTVARKVVQLFSQTPLSSGSLAALDKHFERRAIA